ncbi:MAG: hypothetical protein ACXAB7_19765 [Candidatus Kariarchaeaceae archaeon]
MRPIIQSIRDRNRVIESYVPEEEEYFSTSEPKAIADDIEN